MRTFKCQGGLIQGESAGSVCTCTSLPLRNGLVLFHSPKFNYMAYSYSSLGELENAPSKPLQHLL